MKQCAGIFHAFILKIEKHYCLETVHVRFKYSHTSNMG